MADRTANRVFVMPTEELAGELKDKLEEALVANNDWTDCPFTISVAPLFQFTVSFATDTEQNGLFAASVESLVEQTAREIATQMQPQRPEEA